MAIPARRRVADLAAFGFALLATLFGLVWLFWILWMTLREGAGALRKYRDAIGRRQEHKTVETCLCAVRGILRGNCDCERRADEARRGDWIPRKVIQ